MGLTTPTVTRDGCAVVAPEGTIDLHTSPRLKHQLTDVLEEATPELVVDLSRVDFVDSSGLGVLVCTLKYIRVRGGSFCLVCPPGPILRLLRITGLDRVFTVYATVENALETSLGGADRSLADPQVEVVPQGLDAALEASAVVAPPAPPPLHEVLSYERRGGRTHRRPCRW